MSDDADEATTAFERRLVYERDGARNALAVAIRYRNAAEAEIDRLRKIPTLADAPARVLLYRGHRQMAADLLFGTSERHEADYSWHKRQADDLFEAMTEAERLICRGLPDVKSAALRDIG